VIPTFFVFLERNFCTNDTGLGKDGKAMAQQVRTLDKARLGTLRRGAVTGDKMLLVDAALRLHLAL